MFVQSTQFVLVLYIAVIRYNKCS